MPGSVATHFNNHIPNDGDAWKIQPEDIGNLVADLLEMNPRTLPSKIEVRPSRPGKGYFFSHTKKFYPVLFSKLACRSFCFVLIVFFVFAILGTVIV